MNEQIILAGGCFWCMVKPFDHNDGVISVVSGYSNGKIAHPTYEQVCRGHTGHTEAVLITFDNALISLEEILTIYWRLIDPTDSEGQFEDRGPNYRPAIIYFTKEQKTIAEHSKQNLINENRFDKPIIVPIEPYLNFYPAEEYHQDFYKKSPARYHANEASSFRSSFIAKTWE